MNKVVKYGALIAFLLIVGVMLLQPEEAHKEVEKEVAIEHVDADVVVDADADVSADADVIPVDDKQGCCSHHKGVCSEDAKGRVVCCDGTISVSCKKELLAK